MSHYPEAEPLDDSIYDMESILIDNRNGNYDGDPEPYRHTAIILASITNGQFTQARRQFAAYGDTTSLLEAAREIGMDPVELARRINVL